tara:strand:- start:1401 stop:1622 length:222 start_codon:yes stop_codon:yes gene_type:complete
LWNAEVEGARMHRSVIAIAERTRVMLSWLAAASRWPHFGADAIAMLWDPDDFPNHNAPSPRCGGAVPVLKQLP